MNSNHPNPDPRIDELVAAIQWLTDTHGHFTLQAGFPDMVVIVGQMQLALRHPMNTGDGAAEARRILEDIITTLERADPRVGKFLRAGFDPSQDAPAQKAEAHPGTAPDFAIAITPTEKVTTIDGVQVRLWEGVASGGVRCRVFVYRVCPLIVHDEDVDEFERALASIPAPKLVQLIEIMEAP